MKEFQLPLPALISLLIVVGSGAISQINAHDFTIEEATIEEIQRAFADERLTSRMLVDFYLKQIEALTPMLRSVVEVNPEARDEADEADRRWREANVNWLPVGGLDGVPVLVKDTIVTKDKMNTTAGSYALVGSVVARDAGVVEKLRKAGAVILGKASLSEWYSFRALGVPNGWCARAGQGVNPYVASGETCGSSSGSAISVAANMVAVSLGTETHGSILCPSDHNSVVGFKPTVGLTTRAGVIPIMSRHDTVGPIARTVSDAVYVLDAIVGFDSRDAEATSQGSKFIPQGGYKQFLNPNGSSGKRIGVVRNPFADKFHSMQAFENHLHTLRQKGAVIVDHLEIADIDIILSSKRSGELTVMLAEFKLLLNDYLKELIGSPVRSLADVIAFNNKHAELEKIKEYGQATFIQSKKTNGFGKKEKKAIETMANLSRNGFEKLMRENELDAIVTLGSGCVSVLAIGGYPGITVPAGYGKDDGLPFGICFGGLKGTEPKLIEIAYAFEQATMMRRPPFHNSMDYQISHSGF
ncbi:LOW QUALITY PROTEIN: probable amidase At4g34880 [Benincasa hispida]|uniref:LOW QUALITY PROTEIN: probable amidase At4g34880 n=1 Tax=Benincasa hispida TaxID=102211 RepID=UPI0019005F83|nr:LOW QUALITY PROTEIN: probable amidase At4g34880 [Benincasa hispida]